MYLISTIISLFLFQEIDAWELFATTRLERGYDEFFNQEIDVPVFSDEIKRLNGKKITVTGYVIPLESSASQSYFVLSRFPFQSCFFCGAAGPETVMEVYASIEKPKMDERITVEGTLEINSSDPMQLFFLLKDASIIN